MGEGRGGRGGGGQNEGAEGHAETRRGTHSGDRARAATALGAALLLAGCGGTTSAPLQPSVDDPHSRPIGLGAEYHPAPGAEPVPGLACRTGSRSRYGVHLELFANRFVVIVPAGIGVAPPRTRRGAYVVAGRCSFPARTIEPTGVVQVERAAHLTLGDLFSTWGRRLDREHLLSFTGRLTVFVAGKRWNGDPRAIPLARHTEIVLEVGGFVPPKVGYRFRPGL